MKLKVSKDQIALVTGQLLLPAEFLRGIGLRTPNFSNQIKFTKRWFKMVLTSHKPSQVGTGCKPTRFIRTLTAQIKTTQTEYQKPELRNWSEIQNYEMMSDFQYFCIELEANKWTFQNSQAYLTGKTNTIYLSLSSIRGRLSFESSTSAASRSFSLSFLRLKMPDWKLLNILGNGA